MSNPSNYTVGWICAIATEYVAARVFLDETHAGPDHVSTHDNNDYTLGKIGKHNVVIAVLPDGEYGVSAAASVARDMMHSFPNVRIGLMVGIGGGAPSPEHDIRLGDIVVSAPRDGNGGVLQYDFGKSIQDQVFRPTGFLDQPPAVLRAAVNGIKAQYEDEGHCLDEEVRSIIQKKPRLRKKYSRPDPSSDKLYESKFTHPPDDHSSCSKSCADPLKLVVRLERTEDEDNPAVHYGLIASGSQLIKDALVRDRLSKEKGVLCFEMEASGLMNYFPCLVIRGICDYSDSHKNKEWQGYAAMVAAAYAKDLLLRVSPNRVEAERSLGDILSEMENVQKNISECIQNLGQDINLAKLQPVESAAYSSHDNEHEPFCHPGTRVDILRQIREWVSEREGKCVYWLQGMAGTGKSTITRTVASELEGAGVLGASFFFKRGEGDRGKAARFFTTIAAQLAHKHPCLARHIQKALETDSSITTKAITMQFRDLLLQPLRNIETDPEAPHLTIIVVDALDKCDREGDAQTIISLLPQLKQMLSPRIKFFVTSRPEFPILLQFDKISGTYQDLVLHKVNEAVVYADIFSFLESALFKTRDTYNRLVPEGRKLPFHWPDRADIHKLAKRAVPLFIFAATASRFINERKLGPPNMQLAKILEYQSSEMSTLGATYSPVLNQLLVGLNAAGQEKVIGEFRDIVGSIVVLATPLSMAALSGLLKIDREVVENWLDLLHSVLDIPSGPEGRVKPLHLSFRDYLVGDETHRFWVDERATHKRLAIKCLELLMDNNYLKKDICGLRELGALRQEVDDETINACLPSEVQYACLYWVHHLKSSGVRLHDGHNAFHFLQVHFLHWLEALCLVDRVPEGIESIVELQAMFENDTNAWQFVNDAKRFLLHCKPGIVLAPLQLYASALLFAPRESVIRETFGDYIGWVAVQPTLETKWSARLLSIESDRGLTSVAFTNDGAQIASGSVVGTTQIWDTDTGQLLYSLAYDGGEDRKTVDTPRQGDVPFDDQLYFALNAVSSDFAPHDEAVMAVAFSSDSKWLATGLYDGGVRIWNNATRSLERTLRGHDMRVTSLTMSGKGFPSRGSPRPKCQLASGSRDGSIHIWDVELGALQYTLDVGCYAVTSLAYSNTELPSDSPRLAAGSIDGNIRIWDAPTTAPRYTLPHNGGSEDSLYKVTASFSNDGKHLASRAERSVKIWDPVTGALRYRIGIRPQLFSPPGIAFLSGEEFAVPGEASIKVFDTLTGNLLHRIENNGGTWAVSAASSNKSRRFMCGLVHGEINVWDAAAMGKFDVAPHGYGGFPKVAFTSDSRWLGVSFNTRAPKIWDALSGTPQFTADGPGRNRGPLRQYQFSLDNNQLALLYVEGAAAIWDLATGSLQYTIECGVDVLAFSNKGHLASCSYSTRTVNVWDARSGKLQWSNEGPYKIPPLMAHKATLLFSGDCTRLMCDLGVIAIWDVTTGSLQHTLDEPESLNVVNFRRPIAISDNGKLLVVYICHVQFDRQIEIWDVEAQIRRRVIKNSSLVELINGSNSYSSYFIAETPGAEPELHHNATVERTSAGFSLSPDKAWIKWEGERALWIPPNRRSGRCEISPTGTRVAFVYPTGEVVLLGFPDSGPPDR